MNTSAASMCHLMTYRSSSRAVNSRAAHHPAAKALNRRKGVRGRYTQQARLMTTAIKKNQLCNFIEIILRTLLVRNKVQLS